MIMVAVAMVSTCMDNWTWTCIVNQLFVFWFEQVVCGPFKLHKVMFTHYLCSMKYNLVKLFKDVVRCSYKVNNGNEQ